MWLHRTVCTTVIVSKKVLMFREMVIVLHLCRSVHRVGEYLDRYTPLGRYPQSPGQVHPPGRYIPWAPWLCPKSAYVPGDGDSVQNVIPGPKTAYVPGDGDSVQNVIPVDGGIAFYFSLFAFKYYFAWFCPKSDYVPGDGDNVQKVIPVDGSFAYYFSLFALKYYLSLFLKILNKIRRYYSMAGWFHSLFIYFGGIPPWWLPTF